MSLLTVCTAAVVVESPYLSRVQSLMQDVVGPVSMRPSRTGRFRKSLMQATACVGLKCCAGAAVVIWGTFSLMALRQQDCVIASTRRQFSCKAMQIKRSDLVMQGRVIINRTVVFSSTRPRPRIYPILYSAMSRFCSRRLLWTLLLRPRQLPGLWHAVRVW